MRRAVRQRLDDIGDVTPGETVVDAAVQYAQHIPVNVIARMLGFPLEDDDLFRGFVHNVLEGVDLPAEERAGRASTQLDAYIDRQIDEHVANPATTSPRTCSTSSSTARSCRTSTSAGRSCCC